MSNVILHPAFARRAAAEHLSGLGELHRELLRNEGRIASWGVELAQRLLGGHRVLVAGHGGSAAEAQHLTAELVARFHTERRALSAIALSAESPRLTAVDEEVDCDEAIARRVEAQGRHGDVLMLLSTSGRSPGLLAAATAGRRGRLTVWSLTGAAPNPLTDASDEQVALGISAPHAQEGRLIAVHALCIAFDAAIEAWKGGRAP